MTSSNLSPPNCIQGMIELNKNKFVKNVTIPVLDIEDNSMHSVIIILKQYLLKMDKLKPVQNNEINGERKHVYLNPDLVSTFNSLSENTREALKKLNISEIDLCFRNITLTYDNWKAHEIISSILSNSLSFSGYSVVGSIIHVNLKEKLLPYKRIIGQVLLEKNKNCESVVNKVKTIDNSYRNFEMELLAGNDNFITEVKENGCRFQFDFSKVFWNSRLHHEHDRIISKLNYGDILYDVFCGVGPFAIPAAKNGCEVLANDLNPTSCKWLEQNILINKLTGDLRIFNKDGNSFIKENVKEDILKRGKNKIFSESSTKLHIIMNLPSTGYMFLRTFSGLFEKNELSFFPEHLLPVVHFYCFMKSKENLNLKAKELVEQNLNTVLSESNILEIFNVRNVSPNKEIMRVSFSLSKNILEKNKMNNNKHKLEEPSCNDFKQRKIESVIANTNVSFHDIEKMDCAEIK